MKPLETSKGPVFHLWEYVVYWSIFVVFTFPVVLLGAVLRLFLGRTWSKTAPKPAEVKRLLLVQVENLGDFLISAGFNRAVRAAYPNAVITILVDSKFESFISRFPYFDEVIGFNQSGGKAYRLFAGPLRAFQLAKRELWRRKFDLVLNQRWDTDSKHGAVLGMLALGRYHLGFSSKTNLRKRVINIGLDWLYSRVINPPLELPYMVHDGLRGAQLLESLGLPPGGLLCEIFTTPEEEHFAEESLKDCTGLPLIVLGLGATLARRQWPLERYAELATWILTILPSAHFLVVGHAGDGRDGETFRSALGSRLLNFGGKCSLGQSAALLRRATLYFGTDSGPMHMCAAVGIPVVSFVVFPSNGPVDHPTSPFRYGAVGAPRAEVIYIPDYLPPCSYGCKASVAHCVTTITVEMAKAALVKVLDFPPSGDQRTL